MHPIQFDAARLHAYAGNVNTALFISGFRFGRLAVNLQGIHRKQLRCQSLRRIHVRFPRNTADQIFFDKIQRPDALSLFRLNRILFYRIQVQHVNLCPVPDIFSVLPCDHTAVAADGHAVFLYLFYHYDKLIALKINGINTAAEHQIKQPGPAQIGQRPHFFFQHLIGHVRRQIKDLRQFIGRPVIFIKRHAHTALMNAVIHISIDEKMNIPLIVRFNDLNFMFPQTVPDILLPFPLKAEYPDQFSGLTMTTPELPVHRKYGPLAVVAFQRLNPLRLLDPQINGPIRHRQMRRIKDLIHGPLKRQHVPLGLRPLDTVKFFYAVKIGLILSVRILRLRQIGHGKRTDCLIHILDGNFRLRRLPGT